VTTTRAVGVYRRLLRFYPRPFRDEYGVDMVLLFANQLRDEPAGRVWVRGAVDLAITVPARHLEAHVNRPPNSLVPLLFAGLSAAGAIFGILGGSNVGMLAGGVAVAIVFGALAVTAWRQTRTVTSSGPVPAQWWKLLATGAGALAAVIGATALPVEYPNSLWWPMFIVVLGALVTLGAGAVLGVVRFGNYLHRRAS
jgi:hypothetical protein